MLTITIEKITKIKVDKLGKKIYNKNLGRVFKWPNLLSSSLDSSSGLLLYQMEIVRRSLFFIMLVMLGLNTRFRAKDLVDLVSKYFFGKPRTQIQIHSQQMATCFLSFFWFLIISVLEGKVLIFQDKNGN